MLLSHELARIGAAIFVKFTVSSDDVVWLSPFVSPTGKTTRRRIIMSTTYLLMMFSITISAIIFSFGGSALFDFLISDKDTYWNADRILTLSSGGLLLLYSLYLFYEWYQELKEGVNDQGPNQEKSDKKDPDDQSGDDKHKKEMDEHSPLKVTPPTYGGQIEMEVRTPSESECEETQHIVSLQTAVNEDDKELKEKSKLSQLTICQLIVICIVGSLDDFAVQCSLLLGGTFLWYQLLIGVLFGASFVLMLCLCLGQMECIIHYLEKIPLWLIISSLSTFTIFSAFYPID